MRKPEAINCLASSGEPAGFRWRDALYAVRRVVRSWHADEEWWYHRYFTGIQFWLVEVKNSPGYFELRQDPDGSWWILRDLPALERAA